MSVTSSVGALDVASLVSKLMTSENQILTPLTTLATSYNAQLSAYGQVKSAVSSFQSALTSLSSATFSAQKAGIVNSGIATTGTTPVGVSTDAFTADVNSVDTTTAKAQALKSGGVATGTTFAAGDTLAIKVGTNSPFFIALNSSSTLGGVVDQINAAKTDVTASLVTDDQGQHLVLSSNTTGTANTIQVSGNGSLSKFSYPPAAAETSPMTQSQAPQDATAATSGNYDITVTALASAAKLKSAAIASTQTFTNGILAIKTGTNATVLIKPTTNTLAGVRDAINASSTAGVSATIVSDGTASHLVLTAKNTGAANTVTINGTGDYTAFNTGTSTNDDGTTNASTMSVMASAADAVVTIDGVSINSPTNAVTNAIPGVTLNLAKVTTSADKYNMAITNDTSGIQTAANSFVSAYNALASALTTMTAYNADTKAAGALQGDSTVNNMLSQLRNAVISPVTSAGSLQTLNDVGISFQKDGTIALDTTKLGTATASSFGDIQKLFTSTDGVVTKLSTLVTSFLADDGILASKTTGLTASLKLNSDRQAALQTRLDQIQQTYTTQFNALNVTLTTMQGTQSYLTTQLAALAKSSS